MRVLDRATRSIQLKVKEALHIERTPANTRLNHDGIYELSGCWIATMKKLGGGPTALALITLALALRPLHRAAWASKCSIHAYKALAFCTSFHFCPEDD